MSFDPYYTWLGIPPQEQPPNHYRLLGIALFEKSAAVIANAADRQMAHLRTFQSGPNAAFSQKLLNEVALARVCLLNRKKRAAYDASLKEKPTPPAAPAPPVAAAPIPVAVPVAPLQTLGVEGFPNAVGPWTGAPTSVPRRRRKAKPFPWPLLVAAGIAVALLVVFFVAQNSRPAHEKSVHPIHTPDKPTPTTNRPHVP